MAKGLINSRVMYEDQEPLVRARVTAPAPGPVATAPPAPPAPPAAAPAGRKWIYQEPQAMYGEGDAGFQGMSGGGWLDIATGQLVQGPKDQPPAGDVLKELGGVNEAAMGVQGMLYQGADGSYYAPWIEGGARDATGNRLPQKVNFTPEQVKNMLGGAATADAQAKADTDFGDTLDALIQPEIMIPLFLAAGFAASLGAAGAAGSTEAAMSSLEAVGGMGSGSELVGAAIGSGELTSAAALEAAGMGGATAAGAATEAATAGGGLIESSATMPGGSDVEMLANENINTQLPADQQTMLNDAGGTSVEAVTPGQSDVEQLAQDNVNTQPPADQQTMIQDTGDVLPTTSTSGLPTTGSKVLDKVIVEGGKEVIKSLITSDEPVATTPPPGTQTAAPPVVNNAGFSFSDVLLGYKPAGWMGGW